VLGMNSLSARWGTYRTLFALTGAARTYVAQWRSGVGFPCQGCPDGRCAKGRGVSHKSGRAIGQLSVTPTVLPAPERFQKVVGSTSGNTLSLPGTLTRPLGLESSVAQVFSRATWV
jgi:hypothetical protein